MRALKNKGLISEYSTGVRFSLKYFPIITLSALKSIEALLVGGFMMLWIVGDLPNSQNRLRLTATR